MSDQPISRYPVPRLEDLPQDILERIEAVQAKAGFVPNVFLALAHRPDEFRAFFDYHDALMLREASSLSKAEREMIVVASSAANQCHYCVVAHGAILRIYAKNARIADQIAINYRLAEISERQKVMLEFAVKLAEAPGRVTAADREPLYQAGFDDDAIWDIAAIAAFFGMSNRIAQVSEMRPNDEFYGLGRQPV